MISRRGLVAGLASLIAAPAIVRAESLMPIRGIIMVPSGVATKKWWHIVGTHLRFHENCIVGMHIPVGTKLEPLNRALLEFEEVTSVSQWELDCETSRETANFLTEPMYPQKSWMRDYYDRKVS